MQRETIRSNQSNSFDLHIAQIPQCYPFVKWAGGKTQLLPELEMYIPDNFTRYFEPFLGGGAFFFYLVSSKQLNFTAYLSDINKELINAYRVIKDDVEALIESLKIHEKKYKANPNEYYYKLRAQEVKSLTDVESAARFITLNKTCYNGLYRVNKEGIFNVPIGRYKNPLICDSKNLRNISIALRHTNAHLSVNDYQEALELAGEGDFVYLDPPYKPTSITASFTSYTNGGFRDQNQIGLHETFKKLDGKGCKVMLSNSDTPFIRELYGDFKEYTNQVNAMRAINCKAKMRTGHTELLIRNYEKIDKRTS
jgi:DNA adenine methylase